MAGPLLDPEAVAPGWFDWEAHPGGWLDPEYFIDVVVVVDVPRIHMAPPIPT